MLVRDDFYLVHVYTHTNRLRAEYRMRRLLLFALICIQVSRIIISFIGLDKSLVDDWNKERGIVSSRVALLLRSAEIKPLFYRFVQNLPFEAPVTGRNHAYLYVLWCVWCV